jgi:adenylosuccinate synthase
MKAEIIVDLMFGDGGKGITTDYRCSLYTGKRGHGYTSGLYRPRPIVIRYTGGHQAGHSVHVDGKSHIFSNYGSGGFRGVPTYFTEHCTMYPVTRWNESKALKGKMEEPLVIYHPLVKVTTPYDVVYNRIIEKINKHGSCGLGIGATMARNNETGYKLYAIDLSNKSMLDAKMEQIRLYYRNKLGEITSTKYLLFDEMCGKEVRAFNLAIDNLQITIGSYDILKSYDNLIFEGAQGVLLDMNHGVFPNVTYGNTTSKNALEVCEKIGVTDISIFYITRCYQTRHGNGWMSNNDPIELIRNNHEINVYNEWQGNFKTGELDYDLLNYSIAVDSIYSKTAKKNLVVTCLDQRPGFNFDYTKLKNVTFDKIYNSLSPDSAHMIEFQLPVLS